MLSRIVKRLVIVLVVLIPIAVIVGGVMYFQEEQSLEREAAATPQVPQDFRSMDLDLGKAALPRDVNVHTVQILHRRDDVAVLDVRSPAEYQSGHITGALLLPLQEIGERLGEVPTDKEVIVVCRTGRRSEEAASLLERAGFESILHMTGGMQAWTRAGFEIER